MNERERNELIDTLLDGGIAEADMLRLEAEFTVDPAARKAYLERVGLSQTLAEEAKSLPNAPASADTRRGNSWLAWRPLTAAAAGLALGMICTSVVFGYVRPGQATVPGKSLPLADASFEATPQVPARGIPAVPGVWSGDRVLVVDADNGILPKQGERMLRFLRADNELSPAHSPSYVGEVTQVIDLAPLRATMSGTDHVVDVSAWFNSIATPAGAGYEFAVKAAAFRGAIADAPSLWEDQEASVSRAKHAVVADGEMGTWQHVTVPVVLPSDADILVIECAVVYKGPPSGQSAAEFPGHYVDQVEVRLGGASGSTAVRNPN